MRILYESDLAGSRYHGMAYRIYQFSSEFKKRGHEVIIVAASFSHVRSINPIVNKIITDETIDGIQYKWIKTPKYRGNGIRRVIHMLVYNFRLWFYAKRIAKVFKPDVVIASGVTPLDFVGCNRIAKESNAKVILEVGDLWPLTPIELGGFSPRNPFIVIMQFVERFAYRNSDAIISLLPFAESYMNNHGLKHGKFYYIPNGVIVRDWSVQKEIPKEHSDVIRLHKRRNKYLIAFAGTHSISNALDTLLSVAELLHDTDIEFLLIGDGPIKSELIETANKKQIKNVTFLPSINKEIIPSLLCEMDALYIGFQKQSLYRFGISPNKIFDYMMAAKPIIQAIDAGNNLVKEADCGVYAQPDDPKDIASAILYLKSLSPDEQERLGSNGRKFVIKNHAYDVLTDKFLNVIEQTIYIN